MSDEKVKMEEEMNDELWELKKELDVHFDNWLAEDEKQYKELCENCREYRVLTKRRLGFINDKKVVLEEHLRAEAVKRAKSHRVNMNKFDPISNPKSYSYWRGRLDESLEANNLTEEDLG